MWRLPLFMCCVLIASLCDGASLFREFDWMPACTVIPGDYASEAAVQYEATGRRAAIAVAGPDGTLQSRNGRWITDAEEFLIRTARWRGGNVEADLVLARLVAPTGEPVELTVYVGEENAGVWQITPATDGTAYISYFAIPSNLWINAIASDEVKESGRYDRVDATQIPLRIVTSDPVFSAGYVVYATRDWQFLPQETAGDIARNYTAASGAERQYLEGLIASGLGEWETALAAFSSAAETADHPCMARIARHAHRRTQARTAAAGLGEQGSFHEHYSLGMYAASVKAWDVALQQFRLAVEREPTDFFALYHLAEAMEYNGYPVSEFAPLFERAGIVATGPECNEVRVLAAIHAPAVSGMCARLTYEALNAIITDWQYTEQMVFGASRGAYRMRTDFRVFNTNDMPWVMQAGWIFLPPDEFVPVEGTYDYSIGFANFGSSHAGGPDCGVSGAGGSELGAFRNWEVFLHEWNHQFDWGCIFPESIPIYPTTHDSDGCGKQPIRSMGTGHRSSMFYYIPREDYLRHRLALPVNSDAVIAAWEIVEPVAPPQPPSLEPDALAAWLIDTQGYTQEEITRISNGWVHQMRDKDRPRPVPAFMPYPVPDTYASALLRDWQQRPILDARTEEEYAFVHGADTTLEPQVVTQDGDFMDLLTVFPSASGKCTALARTFIYSVVTQEVRLWFGVNDRLAAWMNGQQLLSGRYLAVAKWDDANRPYMLAHSATLLPGWNTLAVHSQRGGGDWGFSVHMTDRANNEITDVHLSPRLHGGAQTAQHVPPHVGTRYAWDDVRDDYRVLLPQLTEEDLAQLTGIDGIGMEEDVFFLRLPEGVSPVEGSRYIAEPDHTNRELNNFLNWNYDCAAALRYTRDGETRDLLLVRPEYIEEFMTLLPAGEGMVSPAESVLGYIFIEHAGYRTTPDRTSRIAFVIDTRLPTYPIDDLTLLDIL